MVVMLTQQPRIRGLALQLGDRSNETASCRETLQNLGEQLESHIRLEERGLFPALEKSLPEEALNEVSSRLTAYKSQGRPSRGLRCKGSPSRPGRVRG